MPSPTTREIGATQFENVRARLDAGFGFFEDGPFLYVLLDMATHQIDVLLRPASAATASPRRGARAEARSRKSRKESSCSGSPARAPLAA